MTQTHEPADIEVTDTHNVGWAWRCHRCDITRTGLTEQQAVEQADDHRQHGVEVQAP